MTSDLKKAPGKMNNNELHLHEPGQNLAAVSVGLSMTNSCVALS